MTDPTIVRVTEADGVDEYLIDEIVSDARTRQSEVPAVFADATVTNPQVAEWVRDLVSRAIKDRGVGDPRVIRGGSLVLMGPVGVGKTWQAWGAIRALMESGVRCNWRAESVLAMIHQAQSAGFDIDHLLRRIESAGLLFLDDIGAMKGSGFREEIIQRIVDHRWQGMLPTILTTNIDGRRCSLADVAGQRVASRLAQMCKTVEMVGSDRRREAR